MRDGRRNECKPCFQARQKARYDRATALARVRRWQEANPERYAAYRAEYRNRPDRKRAMRDLYYRRTLGITADDVDALIAAQGGVCAMCRRCPERLASWHVDHDHDSMCVRGVLCIDCNQGIGKFREDPARLRAAAEYLERCSR